MLSMKINEVRFLRLKEVLEIIPVSKSTWWEGIKTGRFPKPYKLGQNITVWKETDISELYNTVISGGNHD